ncbi:hypothetical protein D3C84_1108660 [compost metagenome]
MSLEPGDHLAPLRWHHILLGAFGHQVRLGVAGYRHIELFGLVAPDNSFGPGDRRLLVAIVADTERRGLGFARFPGERHVLLRFCPFTVLTNGLLERC